MQWDFCDPRHVTHALVWYVSPLLNGLWGNAEMACERGSRTHCKDCGTDSSAEIVRFAHEPYPSIAWTFLSSIS